MNAHWVKWVSIAALAIAGTLTVACGDDDDDDDNGNAKGGGGASGSGGSAGSGTSGSGGSGAGGAGAPGLPPLDATALKAAIEARKYDPDEFDGAKTKWNCSNDEGLDLADTDIEFHGGTPENVAPARYCANYNLAEQTFDEADGWPIGAAAVKETLDDEGKILEWSYYALKEDGTSWFGARVTPNNADGTEVTVVEGGCATADCHNSQNTEEGAKEWVIKGSAVPKGSDAGWLPPNPRKL